MQKRAAEILKRFLIVAVFSIALAYFEAAVVVYLRAIFYPEGFTFPLSKFGLSPLWKRLLLTEIGRETASILLLAAAAWLFARNRKQRIAFFLTIFALWDIFYYLWLKVLLNWPASIMDWDILFLIPTAWASPVIAPVIVSMIMLTFAAIILYRDAKNKTITVYPIDWISFAASSAIIVISFCIAGSHISRTDYHTHFYFSLFAAGALLAVIQFIKCLRQSSP